MWHIYREIVNYIERMHTQQWIVWLIVAVVIGIFCMRGFGSRTSY